MAYRVINSSCLLFVILITVFLFGRMINYTFGLGVNFADVGLSTADSRESSDHYLVSINRLPRPMKHMATPATTCYLEQDCSLKVYDSETSCGLVSSADSSWTPKRGVAMIFDLLNYNK